MRKPKSGTRLKSPEALLYPGALAIVDRHGSKASQLALLNSGRADGTTRVIPSGAQLLVARDQTDLSSQLYSREGNAPGRKRLRGLYIDLFLSADRAETLFGVVDWLMARYPRAPVVGYTSEAPGALASFCHECNVELISKDSLSSARMIEALPRDVRHALVGFIRCQWRTVALFSRDAMLANHAVVRFFEEQLFAPFDALCLDIRRHMIELAEARGWQARDRHLCTLDAALEGVPIHGLAEARGLGSAFNKHRSELRAVFGADLDALYKGYQQARYFIGQSMYVPDPFTALMSMAERPA